MSENDGPDIGCTCAEIAATVGSRLTDIQIMALCNRIRKRIAQAWDEGWNAAWSPMSMHDRDKGPNPLRSGR